MRSGHIPCGKIPDSHYGGFVDRGIYWASSAGSTIDRAWEADEGSIEFGSLDQDPWTEMPILAVNRALIFELTVAQEVFHHLELVKTLPKDGTEVSGSTKTERVLVNV